MPFGEEILQIVSPFVWPICSGVIPAGNMSTSMPRTQSFPDVENVGGVVSRATKNTSRTPSQPPTRPTSVSTALQKANFLLRNLLHMLCTSISLGSGYQILRRMVCLVMTLGDFSEDWF